MNMVNGMRKIGVQKPGAAKGKEIIEDEEELNFDQDIIEDEDANKEILALEVEPMSKNIGKLDEDKLNILEDADVSNKLNNLQELPKLIIKPENDINLIPIIKISEENLHEIEMLPENLSKNSIDEDLPDSKTIYF